MTFDEWCKNVLKVDPYSFPDDCFDAIVEEWHDYQQQIKESYEQNEKEGD